MLICHKSGTYLCCNNDLWYLMPSEQLPSVYQCETQLTKSRLFLFVFCLLLFCVLVSSKIFLHLELQWTKWSWMNQEIRTFGKSLGSYPDLLHALKGECLLALDSQLSLVVSWCFEPSQPLGIISRLAPSRVDCTYLTTRVDRHCVTNTLSL